MTAEKHHHDFRKGEHQDGKCRTEPLHHARRECKRGAEQNLPEVEIPVIRCESLQNAAVPRG